MRQHVRSFGSPPAEEPEPEPVLQRPPTVGAIVVDIKISPESLARLEQDLAAAVRRGVETGFATAGAQQT